ncbi:MAG: cobalamin-dependent protein [Candidatus Heimdallarchaeota archaeon]
MKILGAAVGSCVHVAGLVNFLRLAEDLGYNTVFLGPANPVSKVIATIEKHEPDIVALSYRLSPQSLVPVLEDLQEQISDLKKLQPKIWLFGGTPPTCGVAQKYSVFKRVFDSSTLPTDVIDYLRGWTDDRGEKAYPTTLLERIEFRKPFPILRAHFGLPSLEETIHGVREIALARCLDVISIGPDQNFQESFFRSEEMTAETGAGGVPIRSREHLEVLWGHSQCGNYPLLRCYSGTRDLTKMAALLNETIHNAWAATPLMWYSELDGRSSRSLDEAVQENQENMQWHGERNIPVECNESHHWSLRDAPDSIAVAMAFLGAYNAKAMGVKTYISQYMLNSPMQTSPQMDLAKMLAKIELIEALHSPAFATVRQIRSGLLSFPSNSAAARAQLASSIQTGMQLNPEIVHVVSYCEANHAATASEVIESCQIASRVIQNCIFGLPSVAYDPVVQKRKTELVSEVRALLDAIICLGEEKEGDPLAEPEVLAKAVGVGLLDTPHFAANGTALGTISTRMIQGACYAIDPDTRKPISEHERIREILGQKATRSTHEDLRQIV